VATTAVDLHSDPVEHAGVVAVLASRVRWEERKILEAFERRGIPHEVVDARTLYTPLTHPGLPGRWELALNREIGHTRALYGALALEGGGVRVVNSAQAIEVCGDKSRTALALQIAGLPTPRTIVALTPDAARAAAADLGYPVVLKPLVGSWGRRVALLRDAEVADAVLDYCAALPAPQAQVVCLQEAIEKPGRDIRVIVVGETPLGAVYRRAAGWRTNVALGAKTVPCPCDERLEALAVEAAVATGAEIAGVDLLEGPDDELYVLEVNAGVEFRGFMSALDVDVPAAIADYVTTKVAA
jgi:[lysine-biosynthesis-protein LysW]---L-2-aminoadipate ligase